MVLRDEIRRYGPTDDCDRCRHPDSRGYTHSATCRARIWQLLNRDAEAGIAWAMRKVDKEKERQERIDRRVVDESRQDAGVDGGERQHDQDVDRLRAGGGSVQGEQTLQFLDRLCLHRRLMMEVCRAHQVYTPPVNQFSLHLLNQYGHHTIMEFLCINEVRLPGHLV